MTVLPGWFPAGAAAGASLTLSQQDSATSSAVTITVPAGVEEGDLLVLLDYAASFGLPSKAIPAGFTEIVDSTVLSIRQTASYKLADGTEGGTDVTGMSGVVVNKALYVFRGNPAITSVSVSTANAEGTTGDPSSQSVTASAGTAPLVVLGCYGANAAIDPRTFSPAKDGEINPTNTLYLAHRIYNSSPADVTIDMDDEGSNILQSFYIEAS